MYAYKIGSVFFICFCCRHAPESFDDEDEWSVEHIGNDQAGCIALDAIIDGAVEKFVWNEEDGIGFLIQDNSYLDFIKSSFIEAGVLLCRLLTVE